MNRNGWSDTQLMQAMAAAAACMGENYHKTMASLSKAGFNCLGSGAYGAAYTRPDMKGYVVKVSSGQGDTYPAYVYWAMANPMACLPEFRHPVFSSDREQFMVMLPRYADCKSELQDSVDYDTATSIIYGYDRPGRMEPKTPLQAAARALRDFFGADVGWDFHRGNLMWDSVTQKYVITDPMCSGNVNELVTKITGKGTEGHVISEQVDFGFGLDAGREWPRPDFADRVVEVQLGAGLSRANQMARPVDNGFYGNALLDELARPRAQGFKMMEFNPEILDFDMELARMPVHNRGRYPQPRMQQLKARVPDALGRAANWVREQGMTPQVARQIAKMAQEWPDERINALRTKWVNFCLAPSMPPFFNKAVLEQPVPEFKKLALRWEVPVSVVRVLRDQWQLENQHWADPQKFRNNLMLDRR